MAFEVPNILDPSFGAYPFEFYQQAIAQHPVLALGDTGMWFVTGADELQEICARPEDFSSDISSLIAGQFHTDPDVAAVIAKGWPQVQVLLMSDPPDHRRFRQLVGSAFSVKRVRAIEQEIRKISEQLIAQLTPGETFDFLTEYAIPLPVAVIAQQLGLPEHMRDKVRFWSDAFTDQLGGMIDKPRAIECANAVVEFQQAMIQEINRRREQPVDDLLSDMVQASSEGDAPLDDAELLSIAQQLMVAGNESTASTLAEGVKLLLTHPEQMQLLQEQPELVGNASEEILRLASPVAGSWRIVKHDLEFRGHTMKAGERVMLRFSAASRDPSQFAQPDHFDLRRANGKTHYAFGRGIHTCVGNLLARKEIEVALEHLLKYFERFELAVPADSLTYSPNIMLRGLSSLPIIGR